MGYFGLLRLRLCRERSIRRGRRQGLWGLGGWRHWLGRCGPGGRLFFVVKQVEHLGAHHPSQHRGGQGAGDRVVVDVDVETVHHIEVRVGKQFFHGGVAHLGCDAVGNKRLEVRLRGELQRVLQRGHGRDLLRAGGSLLLWRSCLRQGCWRLDC